MSRQRGFTLIELMVTLAIVALLGTLAAPSLRTFFVRNSFASIGSEFNGSLLRARNEAISKNMCVTMCMSSTVDNAAPACATAGSDWQAGWIVFMNPACDASLDEPKEKNAAGTLVSKPENMLIARRPGSSSYTLTAPSVGNPGVPVRKIQINARGYTDLTAAGAFKLDYPSSTQLSQAYAFSICVDMLGRSRSAPVGSNCSTY